jgi:hypothetical protein
MRRCWERPWDRSGCLPGVERYYPDGVTVEYRFWDRKDDLQPREVWYRPDGTVARQR